MNVIGKIRMKPTPFAASGEDALMPITAKIQLKAYPNSSSNRTP